jgi:hypothetical protein
VCGRCQPHICDRQLRRPVVRRSRRNNCKRCSGGRSWRGAMSSFTFAIVAKSDNPIYELVVSPKKEEPTVNQQNQFFLHAVRSTHTCFASLRVTLTPVLLSARPPSRRWTLSTRSSGRPTTCFSRYVPIRARPAQSIMPFIRPADCL